MNFDWDEDKNAENIGKHKLDFLDAWEIFQHPILAVNDERQDYGETRYIGIGFLKAFVVVLVFTRRNGDTIRIISLRRARRDERERYAKHVKSLEN